MLAITSPISDECCGAKARVKCISDSVSNVDTPCATTLIKNLAIFTNILSNKLLTPVIK